MVFFHVKLETEDREVATGSDLLGKSLQSAINKSGATPTSGVTVDGILFLCVCVCVCVH